MKSGRRDMSHHEPDSIHNIGPLVHGLLDMLRRALPTTPALIIDARQDASTAQLESSTDSVQTVYETLHPSFAGSIAGYVTLTPASATVSTTPPPLPTATESVTINRPVVQAVAQSTVEAESPNHSPVVASAYSSVSSSATSSAAFFVLPDPSGVATANHSTDGTPTVTVILASPTASPAAGSGTHPVGTFVAIGVVSALALIMFVCWILYHHRRSRLQMQRLDDDEKLMDPMSAISVPADASDARVKTTSSGLSAAPRLSIRPVTHLFAGGWLDRRLSRGENHPPTTSAARLSIAQPRPVPHLVLGFNSAPSRQATSPVNLLAPHSERAASPIPEEPPSPGSLDDARHISPVSSMSAEIESFPQPSAVLPTMSPTSAVPPAVSSSITGPARTTRHAYSTGNVQPVGLSTVKGSAAHTAPTGAAAGAAMAGPLAAAGISPLVRKTSIRKHGLPEPLDLTLPKPLPKLALVPASPANTEFSVSSQSPTQAPVPSTSAAAIADPGGPVNSNVHRVLLEFDPTLEDEMELKAGQLVRLLHEYDDGWALCILLDRSRQGIVPRTCLSTRPVKVRVPPSDRRPDPSVSVLDRVPNQGPGSNGNPLPGRLMPPADHMRSLSPVSRPNPPPRPYIQQGQATMRSCSPFHPSLAPVGPGRAGQNQSLLRPTTPHLGGRSSPRQIGKSIPSRSGARSLPSLRLLVKRLSQALALVPALVPASTSSRLGTFLPVLMTALNLHRTSPRSQSTIPSFPAPPVLTVADSSNLN